MPKAALFYPVTFFAHGQRNSGCACGQKGADPDQKGRHMGGSPRPPRRRGEIMIEIRGKYNTTRVFTDVVDRSAISQVIELCNQFKAGDEG